MSNGKGDNRVNSDTIFAIKHPVPPQRTSEGRFLVDQAVVAKSAMVRTMQDMKETLVTMTDVQSCAKRHPWIVAGSAVGVGFVTGVLLPCSPRKAITNIQSQSEANGQQGCQGRETRTTKSVVLATAGRSLASILQTLVQGLITTVLFSKAQPRTGTPWPRGSTEAVVPEESSG